MQNVLELVKRAAVIDAGIVFDEMPERVALARVEAWESSCAIIGADLDISVLSADSPVGYRNEYMNAFRAEYARLSETVHS